MILSFRSRIVFMIIATVMLVLIPMYVETDGSSSTSRSSISDPQWSTFKSNINRSGSCSYDIAENLGEIIWNTQLSPVVNSSPAIDDHGRIYVGSQNSNLYAVDPNGSILWTYEVGDEIRSSPSLDRKGNICFGSLDGYIYNIDSDGELNWKRYLNSSIYSSPLFVNIDLMFVGTENGSLYCLDPYNGSIKWEFQTEGPILASPSYLYYPALNHLSNIIFPSRDGFLYSLSNDGSLNWEYDLEGASDSTPAISNDLGIYITSDDKGLHCVDREGGRSWRYPIWDDGWCSPSIIDDDRIIIGKSNGEINCLSKTGGVSWIYNADSPIGSSPIISADNKIVFVTQLGNVHCLSEDGELIWVSKAGSGTYSTPAIDNLGNIYTVDINGVLSKIGKKIRYTPSFPRNVSIHVGDMQCLIQWEEPEFDGNTPILGYNVMRWDSEDSVSIVLMIMESDEFAVIDNSVVEGIQYYYHIIAFNEIGDSLPSSQVSGRGEIVPKVPGIPENIRYSVNGVIITLQWSPPKDRGTEPITGYHLYRYDARGALQKDVMIDSRSDFTDSVAEKGQFYYYTVSAVNDVGEGAESDQERVFVIDDEDKITSPPYVSQADNTDDPSDWSGIFCCLFALIGIIGVPIVLIIIITKAINNSDDRKKTEKIWMDNTPRHQRPTMNRPMNTHPKVEQQRPSEPMTPWKNEQTSSSTDISSIIDVIEEPLLEIEEPEKEEEILDIQFDAPEPDHEDIKDPEPIPMEIEEEQEMPTFERPQALSEEEKDEFIVERIMELQEMLSEGEIDQEMYDTLKKRILDQLDE